MKTVNDDFLERASKKYHGCTIEEFKLLTTSVGSNLKKLMILDLTKHKPKYGEIMMAIQTAIFLTQLGLETKVIAFAESDLRNNIYEEVWKQDQSMHKIMKDLKNMFDVFLTPQRICWEIIYDKGEQESIIGNETCLSSSLFGEANKKIFNAHSREEFVKNGCNFFRFNQEFLSMLIASHINNQEYRIHEYFVGDLLKKQSSIENENKFSDVLATNFRYTPGREIKNGNPKQILLMARKLYEIYGKKTLITTSREGKRVLEEKANIEEYPIIFSKPGDFMTESQSIINCMLLYLYQGGGISTWYVLSKKSPFFILARSEPLMHYEKFKLMAHHNKSTQIYRDPTPNKIANFYLDLKRYLGSFLEANYHQ